MVCHFFHNRDTERFQSMLFALKYLEKEPIPEFHWIDEPNEFETGFTRINVPNFTPKGTPGPRIKQPLSEPLDYFQLFYDDKLFEMVR